MNIDMLQDIRIVLELRQRFQDHVILIELGVHRIDLALSKGVVQRVVDGGRSDAKPRRSDAIDDQRNCKPSGLLVGGYILKFL